ncbi:nucleotidyltransferase family protein [Glaciecola sp. 1036]|uniref:nucleotidyltransferase family protein n=1 Tax=Alteromonadaceae TaxID=72275 RepID=UPI003D024B0B
MIAPELIKDCILRPSIVTSLSQKQLSDLVIVLRQQKLLATFAVLAQEQQVFEDLPEQTKRHLLNALVVVSRQNEQVTVEALRIKDILSETSEFVVFLKGAAYSLAKLPLSKGRIYSDIDVLVEEKNIKQCEQALVLDGWAYTEISDYDDMYYRKWAHEIPPMQHITRGTSIDVHHNIIPVVSKDSPKVAKLVPYIQTRADGIQVLNPEMQFVHSAVHLFRNEEYKTALRDLFDLYFMLVSQEQSFIEDVLEVAKDVGFLYETGLALYFINHTLGFNCSDVLITHALGEKSKFRVWLDISIFSRIFVPTHPLIQHSKHATAHFFAMLRGHFIKMPIGLLIYHISMKSFRGIVTKIMGEHFFTPEDSKSQGLK